MSQTPPAPPAASHSKVIVVCIIMIATGIVVFFNWWMKVQNDKRKLDDRPAYKGQLRTNLQATEMSGKKVNIGELEGKVWVCGYLYTQCPRGCAGLALRMKDLQKEFGSNPDFMLVSVSLNAEIDTPERLRAWTEGAKLPPKNWWFLTGETQKDADDLRGYMRDEFKLSLIEIPEKERLNANDRWAHKLALVLVDRKLRIRGTYDFSDPGFYDVYEENLKKDIKAVLAEKD